MPQFAERAHSSERRRAPIANRSSLGEPQRSRAMARPQERADSSSGIWSPVWEVVGGLPARLRTGVEALSGIAMDDVRVHRNSSEPARLGALAFTRGAEIHLGPDQEQHLPHEAWHVVQQKEGRVQATKQMKADTINDDEGLEREADRMGSMALETRAPTLVPWRTAPKKAPKPMVQRQVAPASRFDIRTARLRGEVIARKLRTEGQISKEVRAQINNDLACFEGAVKQAYLAEVKPALIAVTKGPSIPESPFITGSLLAPDTAVPGSVTDDDIYAPVKASEERIQQELVSHEVDVLKTKMTDWLPEDQEFAVKLLREALKTTVSVRPMDVSQQDRQPILDRYEHWMRAVDQQRLKRCADKPPSTAEKTRAAFHGEYLCVSWFSDERSPGQSHASSEIEDLNRQLKLNIGWKTPVDQVREDVQKYRMKTDPKMLQSQEDAAAIVDAMTALAHSPSEAPPKPGTVGEGKVAPKPVPKNPVWVQLKDGTVREFDASELEGSREVRAKVKTPDGTGVVVSRDEPPQSKAVKHPPDPNYVEPPSKFEHPMERRVTNPKHNPGSTSPEPANVDDLYKNAIVDKNGVAWAKDADGVIHRFSEPSIGVRHWNGSTAGSDPITPNEIPIEIKREFGYLK